MWDTMITGDFEGESYTIVGGGQTITGTVPSSLIANEDILNLNTLYTVTCDNSLGDTYTRQKYVEEYYGIYQLQFSSFEATLKVTTDAGARVFVTDGTITYTGVAGSDKFVTLNIGKTGTYSVTATLDNETTASVSVSITEEITYTASVPVFPIVAFDTGTDAEVAQMIRLARRGKIDLQQDGGWEIGDIRTITVSAFNGENSIFFPQQDVEIAISSFDNYMNCGCSMQFDFVSGLSTQIGMSYSGKVQGYAESGMRLITIPALVNALPSWLKDLLLEFSVLSNDRNSATVRETSGNKLALRSEVEILGQNVVSVIGQGSLIPYYNTAANRIKTACITGSVATWWTRSCSSPGAFYDTFVYVTGEGATSNDTWENYTRGLAPFGCI
jgi:hypothetical protein